MATTLFKQLLRRAFLQFGYVTTDDAREMGIDPAQLRLMHSRGAIERCHQGIYRVPNVPDTELDHYMEMHLMTSRKGVLSHDTALGTYEVCDICPSETHLTVPKGFRTRKQGPRYLKLYRRQLDACDIESYEGIPRVTLERAIRDCAGTSAHSHKVPQAIETAHHRGLLSDDLAEELYQLPRGSGITSRG